MSGSTFKALVVRHLAGDTFTRRVENRRVDDLPAGDLLVRVRYSSLNYKDALSASGHRGVTRTYPHTTGIDAAGVVEAGDHPGFAKGQPVIVTGHDLGMNTPGGHAELIRVPADWAVALPEGLTLHEAMAIGTAGFTAALSIIRMEENGLTPSRGDVLVIGATGGVGSQAVAILARLGYRVIASTGKPVAVPFLKQLGATDVIPRDAIQPGANGGLAKTRWAGVVDTVGGELLDAAIRQVQQHGVVTCCGMIGSDALHTSIFPFILRGISLLGIDSADTSAERRRDVWQRLASDLMPPHLEHLAAECALEELPERMDRMLAGQSRGRVVVRITCNEA